MGGISVDNKGGNNIGSSMQIKIYQSILSKISVKLLLKNFNVYKYFYKFNIYIKINKEK